MEKHATIIGNNIEEKLQPKAIQPDYLTRLFADLKTEVMGALDQVEAREKILEDALKNIASYEVPGGDEYAFSVSNAFEDVQKSAISALEDRDAFKWRQENP